MLTIILVLLALMLAGFLALAGYVYSHRFKLHVRTERTPDMERLPVEGYSGKYGYLSGQPIGIHASSIDPALEVSLIDCDGNILAGAKTEAEYQVVSNDASASGCAWPETVVLDTPPGLHQGYLDCRLSDGVNAFHFPILISSRRRDHRVAVLAPVSTWTAYNAWGGRSLYQNAMGDGNVYKVSSQRPNTAFSLNHQLPIEMNIFNWFDREYDAQLLPDHALGLREGVDWDSLLAAKVIVLNYHCEYISCAMYRGIELLMSRGASVIVAGANNLWWKVRWDRDHTVMECHKDVSGFSRPWSMGGRWQHNLKFSEQMFGVSFDPSAYGERFPYEVTAPSHWAYAKVDVAEGTIFGRSGLTGKKPICAIEFDRPTILSRDTTVLARAKADRELPRDHGSLALREISSTQGVLSFGSVETGAGLGIDPILTHVVKNVMARYLA